jgi:hypothetical protein
MVKFYQNLSYQKEIDLRYELRETFFGNSQEISKARQGILRKMRRDDKDKLISCPCRDKLTNEPDIDYHCRICKGFGWFWDDVLIHYFRNDMSYSRESGQNKEHPKDFFYLQHTVDITNEDYIIVVKSDIDGNMILPIKNELYFKIMRADAFRSDNGRIEYWRIRASEERGWSVWYDKR